MAKPDEEVAEKIIEEFRQKGLISEEEVEAFQSNLASGDITAEDWRLFAEKGIAKEGDGHA